MRCVHRGAARQCAAIIAIYGLALTSPLTAQMLSDGDFESGRYVVGTRPAEPGLWQGDLNANVPTENGIVPISGERMVRFINTEPDGPSSRLGAELWQIVDVRGQSRLVSTGRYVASFSAWFNRIPGNARTDRRFSVGIGAYSGDPSTFPQQWMRTDLRYVNAATSSDGDALTWQRVRVNAVLPEATEFIAVHLRAHEDVWNDEIGIEFHGHYVDDASLRFFLLPDFGGGGGGGGGGGQIEPRDLFIIASELSRGASSLVSVSGLQRDQTVILAGSSIGPGRTWISELGVMLQLDRPQLIDTTQSDDSGRATFVIDVPASMAAGRVWLQAAQAGRTSNVVEREIR